MRPGEHFQIDLKHKNQKKEKGNKVEIGIELREYYPSVEWDILGVPAERHEEFYPCCVEPYPGTFHSVLLPPNLNASHLTLGGPSTDLFVARPSIPRPLTRRIGGERRR